MNIFENSKICETFWQFCRFTLVGLIAACTHFYIACFVIQTNIALVIANMIGFVMAFWVSYFGHRYFTFGNRQTSHRKTLFKFMLVAVSGFLFNEFLVLLLQSVSAFSVKQIIIIAIIFTAFITFLMNRYFAFHPEA